MKLIIHHSVTGWNVETKTIKSWGYNKIIRRTGEVLEGTGNAHTYGYNDQIGICLIGNFEKENPSDRQINALIHILKKYKVRYNSIEIVGHKDLRYWGKDNKGVWRWLNATACPGRNLYKLLPKIREEVMKDYKAKWKKCMKYKDNKIDEIEKLRKQLNKCEKEREIDDVKIVKLESDLAALKNDLKKVGDQQKTIDKLEQRYATLEKDNKALKSRLRASNGLNDATIGEIIGAIWDKIKNIKIK